MAEFFPPVIFEIKAKATEAIASFGEVNKELLKMEKNGVLASGALGKMQTASKYAGNALLGLGGVFGAFAVSSIDQLDKVETAQTRLSVAIKDTGVSFDVAKPYIDSADAAMRNLGFSTVDTYSALGTLTAASRNPKVALDTLGVAADLARYKTIPLADAATLLARATIGQAKGLGDLGIAIGKTLPKGASLKQILQAVEERARGSADAFSKTLAGGLQKAQANFKNLEVQVGVGLVPALNRVVEWINKTGIKSLKNFFGVIKDNSGFFQTFVIALAAIWVAPKATALFTTIGLLIKEYQALAAAAGAAALAEGAAGTAGTTGAGINLLTRGIGGPVGVIAAIGATTAFGFYKAGTSKAKPTPPTIGGKGGGAAWAEYRQRLAAWEAEQASLAASKGTNNPIGGSIDSGKKPPAVSTAGSKKTSIKKMEKLTVAGTSTTQVNVYVDGSKASAKVATQNQPLKRP
jgi:hypothetical protein